MKDYGLVSIITPTWNCASFLIDTINSVLSQTYNNWELIISDDCSTDDTFEVIKPFLLKDNRIKYICNKCNSGPAITRNNALKIAKGKWIAFLDSDDLWKSEKLEKQLKFMVENGYSFTYHEYVEISEDGEELGVYVSGIKKVNLFYMLSCCWPGCLTVIYNQEVIGLTQISNIKKNNDTALWLKAVRKSPCYLLNENLAYYRKRNDSVSPKSIFQKILAHYPLFRVAEEMNPIAASFWTIINIFGNGVKKIFFVKKYKLNK